MHDLRGVCSSTFLSTLFDYGSLFYSLKDGVDGGYGLAMRFVYPVLRNTMSAFVRILLSRCCLYASYLRPNPSTVLYARSAQIDYPIAF